MRDLLIILWTVLQSFLVCGFVAATDIEEGFLDPPDSARPWVYWFIMDGNLSREGITADLESMNAAGLGGAILMEVNVGIPRGPVEFMSEKWRSLFKHAIKESERLGLEITLNAGPGWTGSGGPWVQANESMQHLVASATEVEGPSEFDAILPRPEPRPPYFGASGLPESLLKARQDFYLDVAVLAFPQVSDTRLSDVDEKALYVREPYTSKPGVKPFLPAPATYPNSSPSATIRKEEIIDLTHRLKTDGRLKWSVPPGKWTVLRFGRRNTGANTRPAPLPGLGFESDKFDKDALDSHFHNFIGKLLTTIGPQPEVRDRGWNMLHIDSWEMGAQNWSGKFASEFQRRRGYDILPFLPVMTGRIVESVEISERFLWDLRLTAQELVIENHAGHLKELGRSHGFGLSIEPYDMNPTSDLSLGGVADVPMCEFWSHGLGFDSAFSCFEATSIGHTLGKPIVAAEAFTADADEAWKLYPGAMKNQGDWAFCTGVNRFAIHRFAHQPWLDRRPGMTMGPYGVHWDRTQTWWPIVSAYHLYLARCQFMLRQGSPVADICYLAPEGAPHVFRPPPSALTGNLRDRRGYNFDGCAPGTLLSGASDDKGRLALESGATYHLLVLPSFETMTPPLLRKIVELVNSGVTVVGNPPLKSPSLSDYPNCDKEIRSLVHALWGGLKPPSGISTRQVGQGRIVWGNILSREANAEKSLYPAYSSTARVLRDEGLAPDFESEGPIRYTHRRMNGSEIYFVANQEAELVEANCLFRVGRHQPELWDPVAGSTRLLPDYSMVEGRTLVPLRFEPYQSFFILFREQSLKSAGGRNFPETRIVARIDGPWEVFFERSAGESFSVVFEELTDWIKRPESELRYFSGIATYKKSFDLAKAADSLGESISLDVGSVHNMARIRLNGRELGILWCAPWRVDISGVVKQRENLLEIEVANLWPNRLIGDTSLAQDQRETWTTWNPYHSDSPLLPSGLLGPVTLTTNR
jgi:hypothetical protein